LRDAPGRFTPRCPFFDGASRSRARRVQLLYDRERGALRLIADEVATTDVRSGKSSHLVRDYEAGTETSGDHKESVPARFISLVDVSAEDY